MDEEISVEVTPLRSSFEGEVHFFTLDDGYTLLVSVADGMRIVKLLGHQVDGRRVDISQADGGRIRVKLVPS